VLLGVVQLLVVELGFKFTSQHLFTCCRIKVLGWHASLASMHCMSCSQALLFLRFSMRLVAVADAGPIPPGPSSLLGYVTCRFYGVCKPVAGQPQTKAVAGAAGGSGRKQHIMYGNESLYYFFR
jgi:hypothetical protein